MTGTMKRYVIERDLPGIGKASRDQFKKVAATSCEALAKLYGKAQWVHSNVADDKSFCIDLADKMRAQRRGLLFTRSSRTPVAQTAMSVRTTCRCGLDPAMGPSRGRIE